MKFESLSRLADGGICAHFEILKRLLASCVAVEFGLQFNKAEPDVMRTLMGNFNVSTKPTATPAVRAICFEGFWQASYNDCWAKLGSGLEEVRLTRFGDGASHSGIWEECIRGMNEHCRMLTVIDLRYPNGGSVVNEADFVDFISSYGRGLRAAYLDSSLCRDSLVKICAACGDDSGFIMEYLKTPYVRYRYGYRYNFAALGNHLHQLTINTRGGGELNLKAMGEAMPSCGAIRALEVTGMRVPLSPAVLGELLPVRMEKLESVRLHSVHRHTRARDSQLLLWISKVATSLVSLDINVSSPVCGDSLRAVADANPALERLSVVENCGRRQEANPASIELLHDVAVILDVLKGCENLHRASLGFSGQCVGIWRQKMVDTCVALRYRKKAVALRMAFSNGVLDNEGDGRRVEWRAATRQTG